MKTICSILLLSLLTIGCVERTIIGPPGPQGPAGPKGIPAENAFVFEYENIHFTAPSYDVILNYPTGFQGLASDVALVYLLWDVIPSAGGNTEVWRLLPQQLFINDKILVYNYDFSLSDTRLFLDGTFPLDLLNANQTDNWIARIVIVPGDFWSNGRIDPSNYHEVMTAVGVNETNQNRKIMRR